MNRYACGVATGMALALSMAAAPLTAGAAKPAGAGSKRAPAPNVQMTTTAGRRMDLASLRGRVVIVNFWATWCPSCRAALPSLAALYTQRSEEHTSELQSQFHLVCRLLLQKK